MFKVNNEALARTIAQEQGLLHGRSIFDGKWYVGTEKQLQAIGALASTEGE